MYYLDKLTIGACFIFALFMGLIITGLVYLKETTKPSDVELSKQYNTHLKADLLETLGALESLRVKIKRLATNADKRVSQLVTEADQLEPFVTEKLEEYFAP